MHAVSPARLGRRPLSGRQCLAVQSENHLSRIDLLAAVDFGPSSPAGKYGPRCPRRTDNRRKCI